MGINKTAGPSMTALANLKQGPMKAFCNAEVAYCGRITIGGTGIVSTVSGPYVSCVSVPATSGLYRVYVPACKDLGVVVSYGGNTYANKINVSAISAKSGYFDVIIHTAAGVTTPTSGDFFTFIAHARDSKVVA